MRVAALYDIHGNLPALEAVLQASDAAGVEALVIGGDVVAGPMPNETLALLQRLPIPTHFLRGNAESEVLRVLAGEAPGGLSAYADDEARWIAQALTPAHQQFLATWPATVTLTLADWGEVIFCHATLASDLTVFTALTPEETLYSIFAKLNAALVVCGHTHMQFDRRVGGVRVVNARSVGMPFGHTGADWLLLDRAIALNHTDYDLAKAAARIRHTAYPHAVDFAANNVLQAPPRPRRTPCWTSWPRNKSGAKAVNRLLPWSSACRHLLALSWDTPPHRPCLRIRPIWTIMAYSRFCRLPF